MGLNFRGSANRFKYKNQNSFQDKSAPGPRRGVGGDQPGNLARAEKRFGRISSPAKIKKNFYGGEAYFQDGYSGDLGKSRPITQKSRSPLKINEALVAGAGRAAKKFVDVGSAMSEGFSPPEAITPADPGGPKPLATDLDSNVNDGNKPADDDKTKETEKTEKTTNTKTDE
jgi:hypothetical protein